MDIKQQLAKQNIEDARQSTARVRQKLLEEVDVNRLAQERFYGTITIVASGALVLSVTYLGYLKGADGMPVHFYVLRTSWVSLALAVIASIFYHNFHTAYVHFARIREYNFKRKAQREAELKEIDEVRVIDEQGEAWTKGDLRLSLTNEINEYDGRVPHPFILRKVGLEVRSELALPDNQQPPALRSNGPNCVPLVRILTINNKCK